MRVNLAPLWKVQCSVERRNVSTPPPPHPLLLVAPKGQWHQKLSPSLDL
jgi:hypothetical protein